MHLYHAYPTVMQIIVRLKLTSAHIGRRPPPLPLSAPCWRRRHRCHGCRVVATIATVAIVAAAATAATISAATSTVSAAIVTAFWFSALMLPLLLPLLRAPAIVTVGCRRHCHCRHSRKLLPPASSATTPASVLPLFLPLFSLVMFKILLRPRNILNICVAVPCPLQSLPLFLPLSAAASEDLKT